MTCEALVGWRLAMPDNRFEDAVDYSSNREAQATQEIDDAPIRPERIQKGIHVRPHEPAIARLVRSLQARHRPFSIAKRGMDESDAVPWDVLVFAAPLEFRDNRLRFFISAGERVGAPEVGHDASFSRELYRSAESRKCFVITLQGPVR